MDNELFPINLTRAGINAVLAALGKMPTESEVYPLFADIRQQAMEEMKKREAAKQPG
jgi:DNA primase